MDIPSGAAHIENTETLDDPGHINAGAFYRNTIPENLRPNPR
jgi:hypothetical protein